MVSKHEGLIKQVEEFISGEDGLGLDALQEAVDSLNCLDEDGEDFEDEVLEHLANARDALLTLSEEAMTLHNKIKAAI